MATVISNSHHESLMEGNVIRPAVPPAPGEGQMLNPRWLNRYSRGKSANRPAMAMAMAEIIIPKWGLLGEGRMENKEKRYDKSKRTWHPIRWGDGTQ